MENWSVDQVCSWLRQRNLGDLVPKFREEEVSGAALLALNDRMVQQLVKKIGHQALLMDLINKYQQQRSRMESPRDCWETASPTCPDVTSGATDRQILNSSGPVEQKKYLCSPENEEGLIDQRVLKQKKNLKSFFARYKMLQWTSSYALPDFPYDVRCILAEKKCPDHSMRIRIIEFLQADMTKYLEGSLYPSSQQYNVVVNALLQAYPFLDEDGNGFGNKCHIRETIQTNSSYRRGHGHSGSSRKIDAVSSPLLLWKRALKDRFKYVRRPIEDDEQVLRNKCKFGHRRGQTRRPSFAENKPDDVQISVCRSQHFPLPAVVERFAECVKNHWALGPSGYERKHLLPAVTGEAVDLGEPEGIGRWEIPGVHLWSEDYPKVVEKEVRLELEDPVHLGGSAMDAHIEWLKQEYTKTQRNWNEVDRRMNATAEMRRKMISDKAPLKDVLRLFPFLRCPYQLFREFQLLTRMDVYKKTVEILESYSENVLSLSVVRNNPINAMLQENLTRHTEEDILKYMKMTAACLLLPDVFGDDSSLFAAVNEEVKAATPVLEVRNPFDVNSCEFVLHIEREEVAQLADCTMALAALLAAFHVFEIPCPRRIHRTLSFLESLVFEARSPAALPSQLKRGLEAPGSPSS